ncbi:MAG: hypothetical protein ABI585_03000 [Betaproteobacteria bacterium]
MSVSTRNLCRVALVVSGLILGSQAHAASVVVDAGAACTAFSWNQATSTLTCQVTTDCVITGAASAAPGSNVLLTASCPTSTTITWSGGSCAGITGATCTANEAGTGSVTYTADGNNSAPDTHAVNWTNSTVAPTGCSLSASPSSGGPAAQNVTLTAACSSGTTPIALAWSGASGTGGCPTTMGTLSTTCTINAVAANATWNVNFSNSASNNTKSASYSYSQGGGGSFAGCGGGDLKIDSQWGNLVIGTADWGTFGGNIVSVRVQVPTSFLAGGVRTSSWAEFQDGGAPREAVFSTAACDFSDANALKLGGWPAHVFGNQVSFKYKPPGSSGTAYTLTPGSVYYINIRNAYTSGGNSCTSGSCGMRGGLPN